METENAKNLICPKCGGAGRMVIDYASPYLPLRRCSNCMQLLIDRSGPLRPLFCATFLQNIAFSLAFSKNEDAKNRSREKARISLLFGYA